jgi:hypothetical protein
MKFGELYIEGERGCFQPFRTGGQLVNGVDPLRQALQSASASWRKSFSEYEAAAGARGLNLDEVLWQFPGNMNTYFQSAIGSKIRNFAEIRLRPEGTGSSLRESLDGSRVADVLDTLKNGPVQDRMRWGAIKQKFNELFPDLELEVTRTDGKPQVVVVNKSPVFDAPVSSVGAGIAEVVVFLAHLIASDAMVFGLDLPELHLHPHAQRLLLRTIREHSAGNQIVIVTQSPFFISSESISALTVVKKEAGKTSIHQLPHNYFDPYELQGIARHLELWGRDLFFSRGVLVVEGHTELGAFPVLAVSVDLDFDRSGVTITPLGGKHFGLLVKMLRGFSIPWLVVSDRDALMNVDQSIDISGQRVDTSVVLSHLYNLGLLATSEIGIIRQLSVIGTGDAKRYDGEAYAQLNAVARGHDVYVLDPDFEGVLEKAVWGQCTAPTTLPSSKILRGRFLAEEVVKRNAVPSEFREIVSVMCKKVER